MDNKIYMAPFLLVAAYFLAGPIIIAALCALMIIFPATIIRFWWKIFKWVWS